MADQRSLAAQFLLSAAAALRQPDSQPPTNDHEYNSKKQRLARCARVAFTTKTVFTRSRPKNVHQPWPLALKFGAYKGAYKNVGYKLT